MNNPLTKTLDPLVSIYEGGAPSLKDLISVKLVCSLLFWARSHQLIPYFVQHTNYNCRSVSTLHAVALYRDLERITRWIKADCILRSLSAHCFNVCGSSDLGELQHFVILVLPKLPGAPEKILQDTLSSLCSIDKIIRTCCGDSPLLPTAAALQWTYLLSVLLGFSRRHLGVTVQIFKRKLNYWCAVKAYFVQTDRCLYFKSSSTDPPNTGKSHAHDPAHRGRTHQSDWSGGLIWFN